MDLVKVKEQIEILKDEIIYYKIRYQEIDKEMLNEMKELSNMEIEILIRIIERKLQKGRRKFKKILLKNISHG